MPPTSRTRTNGRPAVRIATGLGLAVVAIAAAVALLTRPAPERDAALFQSWEADARQSYDLAIDSRVGLVLPGEAGPKLQSLEQHLSAVLHLRVFDREGAGFRVGFQLDQLDYRLADQRNEGMEIGLGAPFVVLFAPNGRPAAFEFPEAIERAPRALLEEMIRTFQLVQRDAGPEATRETSWTSGEEHATGRYLAYYERRPDGVVRKKKTQYTRVDLDFAMAPGARSSAAGSTAVALRRSAASFRIARQVSWIERAELEEQAVFTIGRQRVGDAAVTARIELASTRPETALALDAAEGWRSMLLAASDALRADARAGLAAGEGMTVDDWIAALDTPTTDRIHARRQLEQALTAGAMRPADVATAIRRSAAPDAAASMIHALERHGTPEAQEALVELMRDEELARLRRLQSIIALGGVESVGEGTVRSLLDMSLATEQGDLATTALLAAGAAGRTLRERDPARASGLGEALHARLRGARDAQETGVALKAMGNMGDPAFGESVAPYVDEDSAYVRASAAWALERMGAVDEAAGLLGRLDVEESGPVRVALVTALDELDLSTADALGTVSDLVLREPDPDARRAMVRYLGRHLEDRPESRETLAFLALEDDSGAVRRLSADLLMGDSHD